MSKRETTAISPTREEDFPAWYQQVVKLGDLAENSPVRGCMVIRPWGYGIWENMQKRLDQRIKETGHENCYFPLFIPLSYLQQEAEHVEGFAKECAVVTHHRLEMVDGKLVPAGKLEEPMIVRPTSETIIGEAFSRWIQSYRDLPMLLNQWANVVRWEMRPRVFLRTAEFLWQEGHTAHASEAEAKEEALKMLGVYEDFMVNTLAVPVITGEKSESERFPGADITYCLEAMMQDGKALQAGTSHYLGQNFAKAQNILFDSESGGQEYAFTTSWGTTTRLIGATIMVHGDDNGMRVPPKVAAYQVVIIPIIPKEAHKEMVEKKVDEVLAVIKEMKYNDEKVRVKVDTRDLRGGEKNWDWIKKGAPIRIEIGPKDVERGTVMLARRDQGPKDKLSLRIDELNQVPEMLEDIHNNYLNQAKKFLKDHTHTNIENYEQFKAHFEQNKNSGFILAPWCGDEESEKLLGPLNVTIRCLPLGLQNTKKGQCVLTGTPARYMAIFSKAY